MSQNNQVQINLADKNPVELKAIAYDVQNVITEYTNVLAAVRRATSIKNTSCFRGAS